MTDEDGSPERPGGLAYEIRQTTPDRTNAVYVDGDLVATGRHVEVRVGTQDAFVADVLGEGGSA